MHNYTLGKSAETFMGKIVFLKGHIEFCKIGKINFKVHVQCYILKGKVVFQGTQPKIDFVGRWAEISRGKLQLSRGTY